MDIKNVTIIGAGVLGTQVSWQAAFHGFNVIVYDLNGDSLDEARKSHGRFAELFKKNRGASEKEIDGALNRLFYTVDLAEALKDADITSESVPEMLDVKKDIYKKMSGLAPRKTIFTTNSSTLLPSQMAAETGRPERFLALHFANPVWDANIGEVMSHAGTDGDVFNEVVGFAKNIGMVPIPIYKEQSGYVLNSLLIPLLSAAGSLLYGGIADFENIDKAWMISTGAKVGPFGIMDMIGMQTIYNIVKTRGESLADQDMLGRAEFYKEKYIDQGKMGVSTGEGFYTYPNPRYLDPDFLK